MRPLALALMRDTFSRHALRRHELRLRALARLAMHAATFLVACVAGLALATVLRAPSRVAPPVPLSPAAWTSLLGTAPVRRLRAALVVEARDCPATLATIELFARPELAGAVGSVTLLIRDGRDSLARYADARLTAEVQVAVVAVPRGLRASLRALGPGPRLVLVDPAGQVAWATRIDPQARDAPTFTRALERVADHYLATELATSRRLP